MQQAEATPLVGASIDSSGETSATHAIVRVAEPPRGREETAWIARFLVSPVPQPAAASSTQPAAIPNYLTLVATTSLLACAGVCTALAFACVGGSIDAFALAAIVGIAASLALDRRAVTSALPQDTPILACIASVALVIVSVCAGDARVGASLGVLVAGAVWFTASWAGPLAASRPLLFHRAVGGCLFLIGQHGLSAC
jgi:hypothetical protein